MIDLVLCELISQNPRWNSNNYCVCWNIMCDNCPSPYNSPIANFHFWKNYCTSTNPYIVTYNNGQFFSLVE